LGEVQKSRLDASFARSHGFGRLSLKKSSRTAHMREFTIYPKKGESFDVTCERFETKSDCFILYNSFDRESAEAFLSFNDVAAIVPRDHSAKSASINYPDGPICFLVYLRDKPTPVKIFAHAFKLEDQVRVGFFGQRKDITGNLIDEWPIADVYIAKSEVVAIVPEDGLVSR
jgi:hypothetical protein